MKLKELNTILEKQRTICYKKDGNSITYHNKDMRLVEGCLYCGEPKAESQWNSYCMLYVRYPDQKVAMEIGTVNAGYDVEEAVDVVKKKGIETQDAFIECIKRKIEAQDHIQLTLIEYLKYIHPTLIDACWESRKVFAQKREQIRQERNKKQEEENQKFVEEQNAEAEKKIAAAIQIIKDGGTLENENVVFYRDIYNSSSYSIINYLMRTNRVNVPIKTQGWINDRLVHVVITKEGRISTRFWKRKNSKGSEKFYEYMFELIRIIRMENQ